MKNLKKLTKRNLREINGGVGNYCPPPADVCAQWCTWTTWQKEHCLNAVVDEPCNC